MSRGEDRQLRAHKYRPLRKNRHIDNILRECAEIRGIFSEEYIGEVLESLKNEVKIAGYYLTQRFSRQDRQRRDAVVFRLDGTKVHLQIKSDKKVAERFRKRHGDEDVRVVFVDYSGSQSFEQLKEKIYINILRGWHWN